MIENKEIAECVGLWLAEGDKKTSAEVTFTNNCMELIIFFHETIKPLYKGKNKPRIYVYSPTDRILISKLQGFIIKNYVDKRANRTYYIYRLAGTEFVKKWKEIVDLVKGYQEYYPDVLRGIFAGEGRVKHDLENNNSRNISISAGSRDSFIEKLLTHFNINFKYIADKRQYWVTGRYLEILNGIKIASLHPEKEVKFRKMIECLKEKHYSPGELKSLLIAELAQFKKTSDLANKFGKSDLRILEVLHEIKKGGIIGNIRIKGNAYWVKKEILDKYLYNGKIELLKQVMKNKNMTAIGQSLNLSRKSIRNRLLKLEKEGVVEKNGGYWMVKGQAKTLAGIDESGSEQ